MIQLISLFSLIFVTQACVPGTGNDLGKMTIHFEVPYTESNRKHYEKLVWEAVEKIANQYRHTIKTNRNHEVRVSSRSDNGKLVVDVQAMYIDCRFERFFAEKFEPYIGKYRFDITCPAQW
ncbi:hypothetical protein Y032_0595g429 [Ancylostoma ceylanicum]|nr:hypothetical protein Y032_0595g429 [Ancylostoma ceylanicum]